MDNEKKFSEVFDAYNKCAAKLDEARLEFQKELRELNEFVYEHLEEISNNEEMASVRHRWEGPEDWSTSKDGPWLNFCASSRIWLDIRQPQNKKFTRRAAYLYFENRFDRELGCFMFQCRLENQNVANEFIDEELVKIIGSKDSEKFPHYGYVKTNRAVLFKKELDSQLFSYLNQDIDNAIDVCNEAVESLFPIIEYLSEENDSEIL